MAEIILFNTKKEEKKIITSLSNSENINLREITMKDLDQKIGYLCGIEGFEKIDKISNYEEKYDFSFMLFKDFSNDEIFSFVKKMQNKNLYIPHKAALTESNIKWTLRFLLDENDQEHKTMILIEEINKLVKIAHDHKEKNGENQQIKNQVQEINQYFQDIENFQITKAIKLKKQLEEMVKKLK